ncbi:MAG: hypothetical protein OXE99_13380 [Cellvibrionales bacterium]|nr:hypothetical protein [Cellvibrionales bacterium]
MKIIVHKIKLKDIKYLSEFKEWVLTKDYVACHDLASVVQFDVCEVSSDPSADCHFIEIIRLSSAEAFEQDMKSDLFHSLEDAFFTMADVVEETVSTLIGDGYRA